MMESSIVILSCIFVSLIYLASGTVDIHFLRHVPRLSNMSYWDTYFRCHTVGETLQWQISNNSLDRYQRQNVAHVLTGNGSNFIYYATLLSSETISENEFSFDSVLIVTSSSNSSVDVACSNGSLLVTALNETDESGIEEATNTSSIFLEYLLTDDKDDSNSTSIFICGVENNFMKLQVGEDGDKSFLFTHFDHIGDERRLPQDIDTMVEQQAILIGLNASYELVTVMFVIHDTPVTLTCGYNQKSVNITSRQLVMTTEVLEITKSLTTSIDTSEPQGSTTNSSPISVSSTMTNEGENDLPVIVAVIVALTIVCGILMVTVIIILVLISCIYKNKRKKENSKNSQSVELKSLEPRPIEQELDTPWRKNNFSEIKKPKKMKSDINYDEFFKQVQYILLTRNKNTFNAATTIITAPNIENATSELTCTDEEDIYIGMIGDHPVCLVNEIENSLVQKLKKAILIFPNTKYLVFVGRCFGIDRNKLKLADIVISSSICLTAEHTELIAPEVRSKFCFYPDRVDELNVTEDRTAKFLVGKIAIGVEILKNKDNAICGCDEISSELLTLFKNGIDMGNNTTKHIQVITIGAVTGYVDGDTVKEYDEWQFMASQAAFHYVASKMNDSHSPGNISYEIKKPKQPTDIHKYKDFREQIEYIISSPHPDSFDAATTNISTPNNEEGNDDIIQIDDCVYIGMIGSHSVGLLRFQNELLKFQHMGDVINKHFPNAKYLIDVGGCICTNREKADLGDVLISEEIACIHCSGESFKTSVNEITTEIKNIFGCPQDVEGLKLPGNRKAKHSLVRFISPGDIGKDKFMNERAKAPDILAQEVVGGVLLQVKKMLKDEGRTIHVILVNGVSCYTDCEENTEWMFVAAQAAFHYVRRKLEMQSKKFPSPDSI